MSALFIFAIAIYAAAAVLLDEKLMDMSVRSIQSEMSLEDLHKKIQECRKEINRNDHSDLCEKLSYISAFNEYKYRIFNNKKVSKKSSKQKNSISVVENTEYEVIFDEYILTNKPFKSKIAIPEEHPALPKKSCQIMNLFSRDSPLRHCETQAGKSESFPIPMPKILANNYNSRIQNITVGESQKVGGEIFDYGRDWPAMVFIGTNSFLPGHNL